MKRAFSSSRIREQEGQQVRVGSSLAGKAVVTAMLFALGGGAAQAGRRCEAPPPSVQSIERGLVLAQRTADSLEQAYKEAGTRVVLLARAGQDLTRYQQYWSHAAWAYRLSQGGWRVVHKLNECKSDQSMLVRQGLGDFFLDDLWRYEAVWHTVPPAWQGNLWNLLQDSARLRTLHEPRYSMVSYAWGTRYQQSNQWALETLALAAEPAVRSREHAQAWLKLKDYTPSVLQIRALTRLGGRMAAGNVAFDDHPNSQRFADKIETVTADSIFAWLEHLAPGGGGRL